MISSFNEKANRYSPFLVSVSAVEAYPKLVDLRVELKRVRPGMADFVIRIATPKFASVQSNTVLSVRGNKAFASFEKTKELAKFIMDAMQKQGDKTYQWANLDLDHLANMLNGSLKYFVQRPNTETLQFVTEALA